MWNNSVRLPPRLSRACPPRLFASSLRVSASRLWLSSLSEANFHLKKESEKWKEKKKNRDKRSFSLRRISPLSLSPAVSDSLPHSYSFTQSCHPLHPNFFLPSRPPSLAFFLHGGIRFLSAVCRLGALNGSSAGLPQAVADTRTHVTY